jgi:hypothetical protein
MKGLWTALCVLAIANLLAIGGLGAWLVQSDRMDMARARKLRELISTTLTAEQSEARRIAAEAEAAKKAEEAAKLASRAPLTAAEQLEARLEATELDRQRAERLKREVQDLRLSLSTEREQLDTEWKKLRDAQKDHADRVAQNLATVGNEQFQKTLTVLSKLEPKDSMSILRQILDGKGVQPLTTSPPSSAPSSPSQAATDQTERPGKAQALAYLDAMDDKIRTAVLNELVKQDPALAAELLEALRVLGTFAEVSPSNP